MSLLFLTVVITRDGWPFGENKSFVLVRRLFEHRFHFLLLFETKC